jgi:ribonuclease VapC
VIRFVLDSSAVLVFLQEEPGFDAVKPLMAEAAISSVNLADVATKLMAKGHSPHHMRQTIAYLALEVIPFDTELALQAGELLTTTRRAGLSLGDRACIVTARRLSLPAITTDRVWQDLGLGIEVRLVR